MIGTQRIHRIGVVIATGAFLALAWLWFGGRSPEAVRPVQRKGPAHLGSQESDAATQGLLPESIAGAERQVVQPTDTIRVRIQQDGRPVPNARAVVLPWTETLTNRLQGLCGVEPTALAPMVRRFVADRSGILQLVDVAPPCFVAVGGEGCAPTGVLIPELPQGDVVLQASQGRQIEGSVRFAAGGAAAGIHIVGRRDVYGDWMFSGLRLEPARIAGMLFESASTSDPDGTFLLQDLPEGNVDILVASAEFSGENITVEVPSEEPVEIVIYPAHILRGIVEDDVTGEPVPDAQVFGYFRREPYQSDVSGLALANAAGEFSIRTRAAGVPPHLRVTALGYATWAREIVPPAYVRVRLSRECETLGAVLTTSGEPVHGANVYAWDAASTDWLSQATSGADGHFRIPFTGTDMRLILLADHPAYERAVINDVVPGQHTTFVLESRNELRGIVRSERDALAGARVRLVAQHDTGTRTYEEWMDSDSEGRFEFSGLAPGEYRIDALHQSHAPRIGLRVKIPTEDEVVVDLVPGSPVTAHVIDGDTGHGIAGAVVAFADEDGSVVAGELPGPVESDGLGVFCINVDPGRPFTLLFSADGYAPRVLRVASVDDLGEEVVLERPAGVEVRLVGSDGVLFRDFVAHVRGAGQIAQEGVPDDSGLVRFRGLSPGAAHLSVARRVVGDGNTAQREFRSRSVVLRAGCSEAVEFHLRRGGSVRGRLISRDPVSLDHGFSISSIGTDGTEPVGTTVNPGGSFLFRDLPLGERVFEVTEMRSDVNFCIVQTAVVEEGREITLEFHLDQGGLRGTVRSTDGSALPGGVVTAIRQESDPPYGAPAKAGSGGAYELRGLVAGTYEVQARAGGHGSRVWPNVVVPQSAGFVELDVVLDPEAVLEILAHDPAGAPLIDATIEVESPFGMQSAGKSHAELLVFRQLAAGRHVIEASHSTYFSARSTVQLTAGESRRVDLHLRERSRLEVQVRDAAGAPLPGLVVEMLDETTGEALTEWLEHGLVTTEPAGAVTDQHGDVTIIGLPVGPYTVYAGERTRSIEVALPHENDKDRVRMFVGW